MEPPLCHAGRRRGKERRLRSGCYTSRCTGLLSGAAASQRRACWHKAKFNYGQGIQEPDIFSASNSLFTLLSQLPDGPQLISQFHIGPIGAVRSRSFDAGVEQYFWNGRAKLGVTVFDNHFSDEIEFVVLAGWPSWACLRGFSMLHPLAPV